METASPSEEQIRARAYQLFIERDYQHGHHLDDWRQAEYELMQLPVEAIAKLEPPLPKRSKRRQTTLISLVQAAMILGAQALPHFKQ